MARYQDRWNTDNFSQPNLAASWVSRDGTRNRKARSLSHALNLWMIVAVAVNSLPTVSIKRAFGGAIALLLKNLTEGVSLSFSLMVVAFIAINLGWALWLKRKSQLGRQIADQIAGFGSSL
jgi:hypothetical protein